MKINMKAPIILLFAFLSLTCKATDMNCEACADTSFPAQTMKKAPSYALFIPVMYYFWQNIYDSNKYDQELNEALRQSGLKHIYHHEDSDEEFISGFDVYGSGVKTSMNGNLIAKDKHACYLSMYYDTSSGMEVGFKDKDDAAQFIKDIKPYVSRREDYQTRTYIDLVSGFMCANGELNEDDDDELLENMKLRLNENGWWFFTISRDF